MSLSAVCLGVLLGLPLMVYAQSVDYSTGSDGSVGTSTVYETTTASYASSYPSSTFSSSYTSASSYNGATTTTTTSDYSTSTNLPAIQTVPFTGQALLVGTCNIPQFTILTFPNGAFFEVPLIGCSDDRPECCPSLNFSQEPQETESESSSATESGTASASVTSGMDTTSSPTPTGVISMLSKAPLTVCPSDMTDLDPVCCPIGFSTYGQSIVGNLPCVQTVTTTVYSPDPSVLASITSVISASMVAASSIATPTISVIVNEVFALGLPCADDEESSGLSTGAKIGIGVGVGVAGLLIIGGVWACLAIRHRRRAKMKKLEEQAQATPTVPQQAPIHPEPGAYAATAAGVDPKHMSTSTTVTGSPQMQQHPQQQGMMAAPVPYGYPQQQHHGYNPAYGYMQTPMPMQQEGFSPYGIHPHHAQQQGIPYALHTSPQGYYPQPHSLSPYSSQPQSPPPVAEVDGGEMPAQSLVATKRDSFGYVGGPGASDTTSTTAVNSNSNTTGIVSAPSPRAELSSQRSQSNPHSRTLSQ